MREGDIIPSRILAWEKRVSSLLHYDLPSHPFPSLIPSLSLSTLFPFPLSLLLYTPSFHFPLLSPPFPFSIFFLPFLPFLPSVSSPYFPSLFPSVPFPLSSLPFLSSPLFPSPSLPLPLSFFPFYPPFSFSLLSHISLSLSFPFSFPDKELDCVKPI